MVSHLTASEPAPAFSATREEAEKVQIVRWDSVNGDPSVAQKRVTHRALLTWRSRSLVSGRSLPWRPRLARCSHRLRQVLCSGV